MFKKEELFKKLSMLIKDMMPTLQWLFKVMSQMQSLEVIVIISWQLMLVKKMAVINPN